MTDRERYRTILARHLPDEAVDWVYDYLDRHHVHFHVASQRRSKYGDYRWPQPGHPFHEISVNGDLSPTLFFWVFLHEAAHLETHLRHQNAAPHGHEWQTEYARLMLETLSFLPADVQPTVRRLALHIPLNRKLMQQVEQQLRGTGGDRSLRLDDLPVGSFFRLVTKPGMLLQSIERRRTRWLCRDVDSGRQYTVSANAEVSCLPSQV